MRPKVLKPVISFSLLLIVSSILFAQSNKYPENLHIYPYLQYATPTSIIIKWETIQPIIGTVSYSQDKSYSIVKDEQSPAKIHEIKLEGLKPGTLYHYTVSFENTVLEPASFTTAPMPGTRNWRMVAYGDNRTYPETHRRIVTQILKLNPSMIIHSGDLVSSGDSYEQWKNEYFDPMKGLSENVTVFPSLGNHERNSPHYYEYMSLPDENGESYYAFDYGNAHFIALNSNANEESFDIDSEQTQWLIKNLKENADAEWKIVYFHHPLFRCHPTRGIEPQRWVWQELFEKYGVDIVVNGHDHYYMRSYAIGNYKGEPGKGIYHLISGGGGANNYPIIPKIHAANRRSVHHITVMDFQGDRIIGRAIDDKGNIFDAFVFDKEAESSPEEFISYEIFKIERDLSDAIVNLPIDEYKGKVEMNHSLEIENPFIHPLEMIFSWEMTKNWKTNPPKTEIIKPGKSIKIELIASNISENIYPLPYARLHFQTPDGKMAFKNNVIKFYPIKLGKKKSVKPLVVKKIPLVDGDLSEIKWDKKVILDQFNDVQGNLPLQRTEIAICMNKAKNILYIAGKVEASEEISNSGIEERDNTRINRYENIKIHIGVENEVYTYILNPKGALLDTRDNTLFWNRNVENWNSTATAAGKSNENGWQFEIEIPLSELDIKEKKTTINFARFDYENKTHYEYSLTYGKSRLDHRNPNYESDWYAVDRFADLVLK